MKILIGNDDGIKSVGIDLLSQYAKDLGDITIITPESQQSARAKSLTFHKPIRVNKEKTLSGLDAYSYNTSPADSVIIYEHFNGRPDLVLSGINSGENTSIHSMLTSGTCAVALEAGLKDIPSFAFSMDVPEKYFFRNEFPGKIDLAAKHSIKIAKAFLEQCDEEFWRNVLFINVNFPDNLTDNTKIVVAQLETYKYKNYLRERKDPKGDAYFWLWGDKREDFDQSKDSALVYLSKLTTVTPVAFTNSNKLLKVAEEIVRTL